MAYQPPSPVTGPDFLSQFMAGWRMGQDRRESQRRDQILAQQAEQDRLDRQMRQEYLKIQQQELKAKMARTKFEDALESVKLRQQAAMQPQTPAMASDVGIQQTTPTDVGPPVSQIAVPQPTQAIPDPAGGADIQMPILTGPQMQAEAQAAQQAEMRKALGMKEAEAAITARYREPKTPESETAAAWKQQPDGTYVNVLTGAVRGRAAPAGAAGTPGAVKLSEGERKGVETAKYALGKMPEWKSYLDKNQDIFGPVAGRMTALKQTGLGRALGVKPDPTVARRQAEFAVMRNAMINSLSGAAVSPAEFERLKEQIPNLTDDPVVIREKLVVLEDYFRERLGGHGVQAPTPSPVTETGGTDEEPPDA